ncbi:MAG: hypothetical protein E6G44_07725 [Actinobacteria bacterium]|nr:MAG: hypothetical protein E6G44_07725 [Actinomycetota bacterium]
MNELDLLREFRSRLGPGQDEQNLGAAWAVLRERLGIAPADLPFGRPPGRGSTGDGGSSRRLPPPPSDS